MKIAIATLLLLVALATAQDECVPCQALIEEDCRVCERRGVDDIGACVHHLLEHEHPHHFHCIHCQHACHTPPTDECEPCRALIEVDCRVCEAKPEVEDIGHCVHELLEREPEHFHCTQCQHGCHHPTTQPPQEPAASTHPPHPTHPPHDECVPCEALIEEDCRVCEMREVDDIGACVHHLLEHEHPHHFHCIHCQHACHNPHHPTTQPPQEPAASTHPHHPTHTHHPTHPHHPTDPPHPPHEDCRVCEALIEVNCEWCESKPEVQDIGHCVHELLEHEPDHFHCTRCQHHCYHPTTPSV